MACQEQLLSGRAHTRTHSHGEARQGARRAKELMAFPGISEMKKRSGSVAGEEAQPCAALLDLSGSVKGNLGV